MGKGTDHGGLFKARLTQAINDGETCFTHNSQEYNTKEASYVLRMESGMRVWDAVYGGSAAEPEPTAETVVGGTTWYYKVLFGGSQEITERAILTLFEDGTYKMMTVTPIIKVTYQYRWFMGNWSIAPDGHLLAQNEHYNQLVPMPHTPENMNSMSAAANYEEGNDGIGSYGGSNESQSVFPPWAYRSDDPIPAGDPLDEFTWRLWNTETEQNQESTNYQFNDSIFFNFMNWIKMDFVDNPTLADMPD
ncbi:MAG: hypothetical protein CL512_05940 [Actinobacteria bacterium]|nr:hypothetical protein [Actinomycetota bacterium]